MSRALRAGIHASFFLTGACSLTYEIAWSRGLDAFVGDAVHAQTLVLGTFMAGLALGAWFFGRFADRTAHGLRAYGGLELGVGLWGLVAPSLLRALAEAAPVLGPAGPALAVLALLPPTVLMGGTLPVLTRYLAEGPSALRRRVARLYAVNSAGAVLGGLLAGFWLVRVFGWDGTLHVVGALNVLLGLALLGLAARAPARAPAEPPADAAADAVEYGARDRRAALVLAAFSGCATMALEITWIRYFGGLLGDTGHGFTLMVAAFIGGIAVGAFWLSTRQAGRLPLVAVLCGALLATGAALAVSVGVYAWLPDALAGLSTNAGAHPLPVYALCFVLMLAPTVAAGIVFPAAVRLGADRAALGGRVGRIYAVNTLGTLAGAAASSLWLLPRLEPAELFSGLAVLYVLAGVWLRWSGAPSAQRRRLPNPLEELGPDPGCGGYEPAGDWVSAHGPGGCEPAGD